MRVLLIISLTMFFVLLICVQGKGESYSPQKTDDDVNAKGVENILLKMDNEISDASGEKGILKAFHPFLTNDSILLPENGHPVRGKDACAELMNKIDMNQREGKLQWKANFAAVSRAGDMGYTHGQFERPAADENDNQKTTTGYYGIIWQKDREGEWKVLAAVGVLLLKNLDQIPLKKQIDPAGMDEATKQVTAVELAFSAYSVENGIPEAFHRFIADDGIALSSAGPPRTKEVYAKAIAAAKESKQPGEKKATLEWEPFVSILAASNDMACNYGPYIYTITSADGTMQHFYGYFCTVWKKQADGNWKFVFDGGNQSPPAAGN